MIWYIEIPFQEQVLCTTGCDKENRIY
jgi:hypothetical protein